ncbi:NitT/TauT family transport system permease protein [Kaistia soli DSM 19436]|uniref:NitT/TauT family transport system permease protein n=1 Tax=Kaistia soli DSM 19436 TaxID=1122133 RepID=A0A1M5DII9_9HYPH|nr:ABC transporter permease [Kaistia soli]SHF66685.1 NitT/TauT family transport system permease protein [Kaistia soli DSM 19436]
MSSPVETSTSGRNALPHTRAGVGRPPGAFRIGSGLDGRTFLAIAIAVFAGLLVVWWAATTSGLVKPIFLPSPGTVWSRMLELSADGTLWKDASISVYRMLIGFALASLMAIPIGILIGCFRVWEAAIEPFVDFVRYMPVVAFVPLSILWAGTGDGQKFVIIWIGTFFQQVLMVMDNVKRVPPDFVGLGRTLGLSESKILARIVLPSALPGIWDTLRISLGWAWTWLVLAELVAATSGLGYRITVSQRYFQTQTIIGYILFLGILGLITDQSMKALERVLFRYQSRQ